MRIDQLPIASSVTNNDTLPVSQNDVTLQVEIGELANTIREAVYGAPFTANTSADMIDTEKVYVYTGTTGGGFTNGHWYYYNGSAWTDGGVYNSAGVQTDTSLTLSGVPADAKVTGDEIEELLTYIFKGKDQTVNYAAGLTWFEISANYGGENPLATPADLPINSYTYTGGSRLSGFPGVVSTNNYWLLCVASLHQQAFRHYFVLEEKTNVCYHGWSTSQTVNVTWVKMYVNVDSTLTTSGDAADAKVTGDFFYLQKDHAKNYPAGLTYFALNGTFSSTNKATPADIPVNSYTYCIGSWLETASGTGFISGFPTSIVNNSNAYYWIIVLGNLHNNNGATRNYIIMKVTSNEICRGRTTDSGATVQWYSMTPPNVDDTLSVSGAAADAAATGEAIYWGKTRAINPPAAYTYFDVANSGLTSVTPADMPANSYMLSGGTRLAVPGFPENRGTGTYDQYWIFCVASRSSSGAGPLLRHYFMFGRFTNYFYEGWSSNGGTDVTWFNAHLAVDTTLSNSGEAADAATVGTALYRNKVHSQNHPAGLTWFISSSFTTITPADIPINSYTFVSGSKLSGFISGLSASRTYWVACMVSLSNSNLREYIILDYRDGATYYGYSSNAGLSVGWVTPATQTIAELKVLFIGNSFTQDSVVYSPFLINEMCPGVKLTVGISYHSGAPFSWYIDYFDSTTKKVDTYSKCTPGSSVWTNGSKTMTIKEVLADELWDVVVFNQASGSMTDTNDDLRTLIGLVSDYVQTQNNHGVRIAYLMPQAPSNETTNMTYAKMVTWVRAQIAANYIDLYIPCGTAIENARNNTTLQTLGRDGLLTWDRLHEIPSEDEEVKYYPGHLQEGLPVMLSSYVTAMTMLEWAGVKYAGIMGNPIRATSDWIISHSIPGRNWDTTTKEPANTDTNAPDIETNYRLAQKCAMAAMVTPWEVTQNIH